MLKEINIGGTTRPVSYGFNALAMFQNMSGLTLTELNSIDTTKMTLTAMIQFAYCGLKDGARKAKQEFGYTTEDVADWLDDDSEAFIALFTEFVQSQSPQDGKASVSSGKKKAKK